LRRDAVLAAALLGGVDPGWQPLLRRLVDRLDDGAAWLARAARATLHGDLHPRNILVDVGTDGTGVRHAFIDLDDVRTGPATLELGAWVADAHYRAMLDRRAPQQAAAACDALLAAYADASRQRIDRAALAWSAAHHLLCQRARRGVVNLKPGRYAGVPALLAMAEAILRAGTVEAAWETAGAAA
jgi:Ser/Thr protein kinase RdoA (MazF antagonist)